MNANESTKRASSRFTKLAALIALAAGLSVANVALGQNSGRGTQRPSKHASPEKMLSVGKDAPKLSVQKWVKGDQVSGFVQGKAYVVEFWATWCGPCRESIPHLTELAKKNKNVTFIGMAASERDNGSKGQKIVEDFVKKQGDAMGYTVAYASDGKMNRDWMEAAGRSGIPSAFVVDTKGKIAYIGHPMEDGFEQAVSKLEAEIAKTKPAENPKQEPGKETGKDKKPEKKPQDKKPANPKDTKPVNPDGGKPAQPGDAKPQEQPVNPAPEDQPKQPG
jgi:thiol-disulfide isomerase/thioredoxin